MAISEGPINIARQASGVTARMKMNYFSEKYTQVKRIFTKIRYFQCLLGATLRCDCFKFFQLFLKLIIVLVCWFTIAIETQRFFCFLYRIKIWLGTPLGVCLCINIWTYLQLIFSQEILRWVRHEYEQTQENQRKCHHNVWYFCVWQVGSANVTQ